MATFPCPRCKVALEVGAPFCTSCGARMADFAVDGAPPGMMPVCGGCGALKASDRGSCMLCGASYTIAKQVPDRTDGRYFTRVLAHLLCRSCGQRSPLNALDVDGMVTCVRCGLTQAYDVSVWSEALETAHGVSDLAFPKPEGRFATAGDPSIADHPAAAVGKSRSALSFDASSVTMDGAVMRTRSLSLEASPGHPLCETCTTPLVAHVEGQHLRIGCEACNTVMRYALPTPIAPIENWPAGIYADDCCVDRPDASMVESAGGAVAIKCPTCNAALEARVEQHFVTCNYCRTACRIPSRTLWALHTDKVEAKPFWLLFEGPSRMRAAHVGRLRSDADHARRARELAERQRLEAERRAEHTRQFEMPGPARYSRNEVLARAGVGMVLTLVVGAIGWGSDIVNVVRTGRAGPGVMAGVFDPASPGTSLGDAPATTPDTPAAVVTYQAVAGCGCDTDATGLSEKVELGVRIGTSMEIGGGYTAVVDWALVGATGPLVTLEASGATAPRTVIESHALDVVVACGQGKLHVVDATKVTTYATDHGTAVATAIAVEGIAQVDSAGTGLTVTCTRGTIEGNRIAWSDRNGTPRYTALPEP